MDNQLQLFLRLQVPVDVVESGDTLPFDVLVEDQHANPVPGAHVRVWWEGALAVSPTEAATDSQGRARFHLTSPDGTEGQFLLQFEVEYPEAIPDAATMEFLIFTPPAPTPVSQDVQVVSAGLAILGLAALAGSEAGRYGLFNALVFPLYTRLKREEVLDHFVRGQIYGHILSNPGEHYTAIRERLKVTNGTLSHHLRTLEVQGFIQSRREGTRKRFYSVNMVLPRDRGIRLSDLQLEMLERIDGGDGPTQKDIADAVGTSQQSVSYNLRALLQEEKVRVEREGRKKRYYPS